MAQHPAAVLEPPAWTGLEVVLQPVTFDRFIGLLEGAVAARACAGARS